MIRAVLLALSASIFTATSSVCQRLGAREAEGRSGTGSGFDVEILLRLIRQPIWLLGILSMIVGFVLQVTALRYGGLAIVQPVLAFELILVFAYMSVLGTRSVARRDWFAAGSMTAGLGLFLYSASPTNGREGASASSWWLAGLGIGVAIIIAIAIAYDWGSHRRTSQTRRAASLGVATGASWGFVAAVIREFSARLDHGLGALFTNWSPYVLIVTGIIAMVLESNAVSAGSLAASQPGFTITDPVVATLLGIVIFGEKIRLGATELCGELVAAVLVIVGAVVLSHSQIVAPTAQSTPDKPPQ